MEKLVDDPDFTTFLISYRNSIRYRYSKENIHKFPELKNVKEESINALVDYFLNVLYPEFERRKELDIAFQTLASFVYSPQKVWNLFGSLGFVLFKLGRHLKKAVQAGISTLQSYIIAHKFEKILLKEVKKIIKRGDNPLDLEIFHSTIKKISRKDAEEFRSDIVKLVKLISDKELIEKTEFAVKMILEKMKSKEKVYSEDDLKGIELGLFVIQKGADVFQNLNTQEIQSLALVIDLVEKDFYEKIVNC